MKFSFKGRGVETKSLLLHRLELALICVADKIGDGTDLFDFSGIGRYIFGVNIFDDHVEGTAQIFFINEGYCYILWQEDFNSEKQEEFLIFLKLDEFNKELLSIEEYKQSQFERISEDDDGFGVWNKVDTKLVRCLKKYSVDFFKV
ncbi:MAG: hypothetical protein EKK54_08015 [Neisseriaceae bacterium]|nr:MAG: hypothetical protein EKK54_08015 [Neisseriaceae bacterium]